MFNRILVPLDGSNLAERALQPALALARQSSGEVLVLRVPVVAPIVGRNDPGLGGGYLDLSAAFSEKMAREYLADVQNSLRSSGVTIRTQLGWGEAAEAIVQARMEEEADLILMSSHGYSGVTRWLLGSVAEKVLHSADCPVMVIESSEPLRRMLLPLDGSPFAEQARRPALNLAVALGLQVTLLRAVPVMSSRQVDELEAFEAGFGERLQQEMREEAQIYLDKLAKEPKQAGLQVETLVCFEPAAESILTYAETHQIDLIAMATHGRTGLKRWMLGSVTEKVLRGASHSMFIVRPAEEAPALAMVRVESQPAEMEGLPSAAAG